MQEEYNTLEVETGSPYRSTCSIYTEAFEKKHPKEGEFDRQSAPGNLHRRKKEIKAKQYGRCAEVLFSFSYSEILG